MKKRKIDIVYKIDFWFLIVILLLLVFFGGLTIFEYTTRDKIIERKNVEINQSRVEGYLQGFNDGQIVFVNGIIERVQDCQIHTITLGEEVVLLQNGGCKK